MNKAQWVILILVTAVLAVTGVCGFFLLKQTNERLLALSGHETVSPTPSPTQAPEAEPTPTAQTTPPDYNSVVTRGMLTMLLAEADVADLSVYQTSRFADVPGMYRYMTAIEWAAENGIAAGVGDGKFAPENPVTREELAVMMSGFMLYKGCATETSIAYDFADKEQISPWALDAVNGMCSFGVLYAKTDGSFGPQGTVTKAEVYTVLSRMAELFPSIEPEVPGGDDLDDYGNWLPPYETPAASPQTVYREETVTIPKE